MLKGLLINEKTGEYEKENKKASYRTIVNHFIGDCVLCNNIIKVDDSIFYNMGEELGDYDDIYQYYLCDVSEEDKKELENYGLIFSYSDLLETDVLCVTHWGISWDYVLTDCPLFETWEELEEYNKKMEV